MQKTVARTCIALTVALICFFSTVIPLAAQDADRPRVLVIVESDSRLPHVQVMLDAMEDALGPEVTEDGEYFIEYLDLLRFGGEAERNILSDFLAARYGGTPLDAVAIIGPNALSFFIDNAARIAPGAPVVVGGIGRETLDRFTAAPAAGLTGVVSDYDLLATLDIAMSAQPDATGITVVAGLAPFDLQWRDTATALLGDSYVGLPVRFLDASSGQSMLAEAAALDPNQIVLMLTVFVDGEGNRYIPAQFTTDLADVSPAPIWSVYPTYLGTGIAGGHVEDLDRTGRALAALLHDAIANRPLPPVQTIPGSPMVDWLAIERHGLDIADLPPDTEVLFYEPTLWERYRLPISLAVAIIAAQAVTIAALIINRRRLIQSQDTLASERAQLVHVSRNLRLGQLSAALAHEINQPLAAIQANADAGARLAVRTPPDSVEITAIFTDIASDVGRAAAIIANLRRLMVKGETAFDIVDLNEIVTATLSLASNELAAQGAQIRTDLAPDRLEVRGNGPQLQQIVLNLAFNAAEAMADLPEQDRVVRIQTARQTDGTMTLSVADVGPGVDADRRDEVFRPFVTSKPTGLGVGLAICRNIARAHGGTLEFTDSTGAGARIQLTLPPPRAAA
jgi:signal transduction histidine kinase